MSDISSGEGGHSANNNDLDSYQNKKDSEKKRREQENFYIEELAMLISHVKDFSDSEDSSAGGDPSRFEKGSILQETVEKLKLLNASKDIQKGEVSSSHSFLPKEILGSLVLEALDGFMFIVSNDGKIDFVSDNVSDYLGFKQEALTEQGIFSYIHHGDHTRFSTFLSPDSWRTWKRLPQNTFGKQGFDRSKVFNLRFLMSNEVKTEEYENMQVSAIVMSNPIENTAEDPKSGLFCIARRISHNEQCELTPVEQFTTKSNRQTLEIETVDTEGLADIYKKNIGSFARGRTLADLVHPADRPLMAEHIENFQRNITDSSRVYRMSLPPPINIIHVKTKTKDFRPQPGHNLPGYIMSTHNIIRENELQIEDLPAMRPELRGLETSSSGPATFSLRSGPGGCSPNTTNNRSEMLEKLLSPPPASPTTDKIRAKLTPHLPAGNGSGNQLLKQLLRPTENEQKSSDVLCFRSNNPRYEEPITIGHLLNEDRRTEEKDSGGTSELLKQLKKPTVSVETQKSNSELAQLLQNSPGSAVHSNLKRSSSVDEGPASKQVPSLESLLSVRPDRTIPPPVPRKWSEIPQEKLPRDIVVDKLKDGPSRNNNSPQSRQTNSRSPLGATRSTPPFRPPVTGGGGGGTPGGQLRTIIRGGAKTNTANTSVTAQPNLAERERESSLLPQFGDIGEAASDFNDLLTDPLFSLLDGVDLGDDSIEHISDQNLAKQKIQEMQKIHEIEQSLKLAEHSFAPSSSPSGGGVVMTQFPGVIQSQPQHRILQQRNPAPGPPNPQLTFPSLSQTAGPGPRSPSIQGTNMEELLKGIPPNVAITTVSEQQPGPLNLPVRMSALERQLSSPAGPVRHLSGDSGGHTLQHQPPPFSRAGRHQSGGEVRLAHSRDSQPPMGALRRASGDSSLQRFSLGGAAGDTFSVVSQEAGPGPNIIRTSAGSQVVRQRVVQGNIRRPGGRTLSQEDLEAYGLSIEVSSDFALPGSHKAAAQPFSPSVQFVSPGPDTITSITSITSIQPNKQVTPSSGPTSQFVISQAPPASTAVSQQQFIQTNQFSPATFRPASNTTAHPFSSQFSPPNTINSKQPFQF